MRDIWAMAAIVVEETILTISLESESFTGAGRKYELRRIDTSPVDIELLSQVGQQRFL